MASPNHIWAGLNAVTELAKQTDLNSLKSSVSSGKTLVANAITGKGVATSSSATFATMANNINSLETMGTYSAYYYETNAFTSTSSKTCNVVVPFGVNKITKLFGTKSFTTDSGNHGTITLDGTRLYAAAGRGSGYSGTVSKLNATTLYFDFSSFGFWTSYLYYLPVLCIGKLNKPPLFS